MGMVSNMVASSPATKMVMVRTMLLTSHPTSHEAW